MHVSRAKVLPVAHAPLLNSTLSVLSSSRTSPPPSDSLITWPCAQGNACVRDTARRQSGMSAGAGSGAGLRRCGAHHVAALHGLLVGRLCDDLDVLCALAAANLVDNDIELDHVVHLRRLAAVLDVAVAAELELFDGLGAVWHLGVLLGGRDIQVAVVVAAHGATAHDGVFVLGVEAAGGELADALGVQLALLVPGRLYRELHLVARLEDAPQVAGAVRAAGGVQDLRDVEEELGVVIAQRPAVPRGRRLRHSLKR